MNFLEAYRLYTARSEPPQEYQTWCAISVLGAILGRKCHMSMGYFNVYPNLYVLLVGSPGMRKSSSLSTARKVLSAIKHLPTAASSITREALIESMADDTSTVKFSVDDRLIRYQQLFAIVGEFSEFIGGKHINEDMIKFMTGIWDEDVFEYKTKNKGKFKIPSPYFSFLGACTTDWIIRNLKADLISDGFSRRTLFIYADNKNCSNPIPRLTSDELEAQQILAKEVARIYKIAGEFTFSAEARDLFIKFYEQLPEVEKKAPDRLKHYFSTKPNLVQKVAMCLSASVCSTRVIDSHCLRTTLKLFEMNERYMYKIFGAMGRNELKAELVKILDKIKARPGISKNQIVLDSYGDLRESEINEVLNVLTETREVRVELAPGGVNFVYYPTEAQKTHEVESPLVLVSRLKRPEELGLAPAIGVELPAHWSPKPESSKDDSSSGQVETARQTEQSDTPAEPLVQPLLRKGKVVKQTEHRQKGLLDDLQ